MATSGQQPINPLSEAKAALGRKDFARAVDEATAAIGTASKNAMAYLVRAEALRRLNQPDRALADLAVAIRLQPDRPGSYVVRAEILKKRCQFDQAIADATHAIFLDPLNAAAYSIRASCRQSIGDVEGASQDHNELFRIDPTRQPSPMTTQDIPGRTPAMISADRTRVAVRDDDRHQFADVEPMVASRPLPRTRPRRKLPNRGLSYGLVMFGVGAIAATLLILRGGGASAPGREPQRPAVSTSAPTVEVGDRKEGPDDGVNQDESNELAVVTEPPKAPNEPAHQEVADQPPADSKSKSIQIRLHVSEDGDCRLLIDARAEGQPEEKVEGEPVKLAGVPNAIVRKSEEGRHRITYSFNEVASTADFGLFNGLVPVNPAGLSIDRRSGLLVMTPIEGVIKQGKKAILEFPRLLRAPIDLAVDVEDRIPGTLILQLNSQTSPGPFGLRLYPAPQDQDSIHAGFFFYPVVNGKRGKEMSMLDRNISFGDISESDFHLPVAKDFSTDRFRFGLAFFSDTSLTIHRLDVQATVPPSFGFSLGKDNGGKKIDTAFEGGPSAKAGLKAGDILVSIDGKKFTSGTEAVSWLAGLPIDKEAEFKILRAGKEKTILIKGE